MSTEKFKDHLVVDEDHHRAVRSVAAEKKIDMIDFVHFILDQDADIKSALRRIRNTE